MPYPIKTLSQLRLEIAQDIAAMLAGTDPLLRFSNLQIMGTAQAGLMREVYSYLGYIALNAVPFTSEDEWLEAWAAFKGVFRVPANQAIGSVTWVGAPDGTTLPKGSAFTRGDGVSYTTTSAAEVTGGTVTAPAIADADPAGLTGAFGNCDVGVLMTLSVVVAGISSTGSVSIEFTGGADLETDDSLRARMLLAFQSEDHGGDAADYIRWALAVPGVTRAWCVPNGLGNGTVLIYTMFDVSEAAHGGFPQGVNGVATSEPRDTPATLDLLAVANALFPNEPVTALVYAYKPVAFPIDFAFASTSGWTSDVKTNVTAAINTVLLADGTIDPAGGTTLVPLADLTSAIDAVPGTGAYVLNAPNANVVVPFGQLPTLGAQTYT